MYRMAIGQGEQIFRLLTVLGRPWRTKSNGNTRHLAVQLAVLLAV